jgi:hypothetical protein
MQIQTSKDWPAIETELMERAKTLPAASKDLQKICKNIQILVSLLSKEEIECRRLQKQTIKHTELVSKVNEQIALLEQLITFAALFQSH